MTATTLQQLQGSGQRNVSPVAQLGNFMEKLKGQMSLALPKHMTADRMTRLALTAFSTSPQLQKCTHQSIAASIMTAAQLGLEPGVNGAGFLIPYKDTCTFVPGWKGLVDLVARSGRGTVYTGVIFKDQEYTFTDGARRDLVIHKETDLQDPKDITHAYAIGWVKDSAMPIIELWRVTKIEKHRDKYNKVGSRHYSFRDWEMYARKIPLLQVLKYMPCSIEVSNAIAVSNAAEEGRGVTIEHGVVLDTESPSHDEPAKDMGAAETVNTQTGEVTQAEPEPVVSQQVTTEPEAEPQQAAPRTRKPMPVME
jgi:recombination protein RecT